MSNDSWKDIQFAKYSPPLPQRVNNLRQGANLPDFVTNVPAPKYDIIYPVVTPLRNFVPPTSQNGNLLDLKALIHPATLIKLMTNETLTKSAFFSLWTTKANPSDSIDSIIGASSWNITVLILAYGQEAVKNSKDRSSPAHFVNYWHAEDTKLYALLNSYYLGNYYTNYRQMLLPYLTTICVDKDPIRAGHQSKDLYTNFLKGQYNNVMTVQTSYEVFVYTDDIVGPRPVYINGQ